MNELSSKRQRTESQSDLSASRPLSSVDEDSSTVMTTSANATKTTATTYPFMKQVEETISKVLQVYGLDDDDDGKVGSSRTSQEESTKKDSSSIAQIPIQDRQAVVIARSLHVRLAKARQQSICERCWFRSEYCFCHQCPTMEASLSPCSVRRIFVLLHYREVLMGVDTAKLILMALPNVRLVIAGIPSNYQASLKELEEAMNEKRVCVLFPDDHAKTIQELSCPAGKHPTTTGANGSDDSKEQATTDSSSTAWDVVVIDGTWQQARRMKGSYFPTTTTPTVKLSDAALQLLQEVLPTSATTLDNNETPRLPLPGHQLRKHCIPWKRIATFEAVRLFLMDCLASEQDQAQPPEWIVKLQDYLRIANEAALQQKKFPSGKGKQQQQQQSTK